MTYLFRFIVVLMSKLFVLIGFLSFVNLAGQIDTITPDYFESELDGWQSEDFRWPDMKMEYDTLVSKNYSFVIEALSFRVPVAQVVIHEFTESENTGDSVIWDETNTDTAVVHDWTGIARAESIWVPFDSGFYKLDTLWDPAEPNRWLAVDTANGRYVYTDFFLRGASNEIFQVNNWLEHFVDKHPYYLFDLSYFNGEEWIALVANKDVSFLEQEFFLSKPNNMGWFSVELSAKGDDLAPDIYLIIKLINV